MTGLDEDDIIYVSFSNKIYEIPFYVVVDHNMCSVIIAIRGTLSLKDALTDLTADCDTIDIPGRYNYGKLRAHVTAPIILLGFFEKLVSNQKKRPFCLTLTHDMCSVIIAIRGTLSLKDALTDLTADCDTIDIPGMIVRIREEGGGSQ